MNDTTPNHEPHWHALDSGAVLSKLNSDSHGLSTEEATRRLTQYGVNRLNPIQKRGVFARLAIQFHNVLIYVLLVAGAVTFLLQHYVDSGVIFGVVIVNALIGFIQEGKAERALDAIRHMLSQHAMVRREGSLVEIDAEQIVPGDIVTLQPGDKVPADVRLLHTRELQIDEAILTGESVPVYKTPAPIDAQAIIAEHTNIAHSGTLVTSGQGYGVVVGTGESTEIGRISQLLGRVRTLATPLLRQLTTFGHWLSIAIAVLAAATFFFGVFFRSYTMEDMFLAAVGLAVAAIPEGLPAIITITLALGVQRMAQRNAIIRRLPAVETLGSVTVICSDKTGTLTRNEMTVQRVVTATEVFEVSGVGYAPHGEFMLNETAVDIEHHPVLQELAKAALLCNDAKLFETNEQWQIQGDPTEAALCTLGIKAGLDPEFQHREWPRTDEIPFESQHQFMATLHHDHAGHGFLYLKGAPERVLDMCSSERGADGQDHELRRSHWEASIHAMAQNGQRLLAIAFKATDVPRQSLRFSDVESGLTLLGIVGLIDPPRQEAIAAVASCHSAGIRVKMITGDHTVTALAIAKSMGISDGKRVMSGQEIENSSDDDLTEAVSDCDVFARTTPEHKLRLVQSIQANHEIVAMTGDGVNDAPALKRADVGVAMGMKGTEVAKEASEMVLADDNFASIAHAVEEGRTVYDNIKKSMLFILPTNGGEALTIVAAILFGRLLPITPVQILWVNMITAVTLALALAFEPAEPDIMKRAPRAAQEPILSGFLIWRIVLVSLILVTGTFGLFIWERESGTSIETARTIAVNTLVAFEIFYLFNARFLLASSMSRAGFTGNRYVWVAIAVLIVFQLLFTYLPAMQVLFKTTALDLAAWARILCVAFSVFILVELEKWYFRSKLQRTS